MSEFDTKPTTKKTSVKETPQALNEVADDGPEVVPEKPKFSPEELAKVFDDILFQGEYEEEVTIKGRLKVKFRMRTASDINEITNELDKTQVKLIDTLQNQRSFLNLAYALVSYQGTNLSGAPIEKKKEFLGRLGGPVVNLLGNALFSFDQKVFAACEEGEANF